MKSQYEIFNYLKTFMNSYYDKNNNRKIQKFYKFLIKLQ